MAKTQPESKPEETSDSDDLLSDSGSGSGSDSGSESDSEHHTPPPKPSNPTPQNPPPATPNSDSESGSLSGSDSESESSQPEPEPKPKPNEVPLNTKPKPKPTSSVQSSAKKRVGGKVDESPDGKKVKKNDLLVKKDEKMEGGGVEESSKKLFQRVFSEDDEIGLLKGILEFMEKKKSDPVAKIDEFVEFVRSFMHFDASKAQLLNKMKRLKGKYKGNASKVKDGQDVKISKQHERESYELSKKIWGGLDGENDSGSGGLETKKVNGSVVKKCVNKNVVPKVSSKGEDSVTVAALPVKDDDKLNATNAGSNGVADFVGFSMNSALEQRIMMEEIKNVDMEVQKELGKKLSEIEVAELELCARRCEYVAQKARLMIAAKKNQH